MLSLIRKQDGRIHRTLGCGHNNLSLLLAGTKYRNKCYYSALGLDSSASLHDIKSAYYKLSMKFHPDKNYGCAEAANKFREITEAYEVLSNADKKLKYDQEIFRSQYRKPFGGIPYEKSTAYTFRERSDPRTGRSKEFNYDEHFQRHYEEIMRRNQEHIRMMRQARMRWERDPYANPYARQSRTRPNPDGFNDNKTGMFNVPWSAMMFVWLLMVLFLVTELKKADVPRTPDFSDRSNKSK